MSYFDLQLYCTLNNLTSPFRFFFYLLLSNIGEYLHISVFSLPFVIINTVMSKYLSAQGITRPSLYATSICVVLTVPLNYVFIYETPLGYRGAAVSYVLNNGTNTIVLLTYLFATTAHRRCWDGLKIKEVVTDWQSIKEFLKYVVFL